MILMLVIFHQLFLEIVSSKILLIFAVVRVQKRGALKDGKESLYALSPTGVVKSTSARFKS